MAQRIATWCVLLLIGVFPAVPPEHVHRSTDPADGHEHVLVHRHLQAHHADHHGASHRPMVDDDDAVLTVDTPFTRPAPTRGLHAPAVVVRLLDEPPASPITAGPAEYVERLIHGPPRAPASLRAPPSVFRI